MVVKDNGIEEQPLRTEGHAFIVRIWRQNVSGADETSVWRGSIDHVGGGERLYFSDLAAIGRFIQDQAEIDLHGQSSRWKTMRDWFTHLFKN